MLSFSPVCLDNAMQMRAYMEHQPFRSCDYTIGNIFQWRAYFSSHFAVAANMLIMNVDYPDEGRYYTYPVGSGQMDDAITAIEQDAMECVRPLRFCCVPVEGVSVLQARYGSRCLLSTRRDWADYLYSAPDLITFKGKRYHSQRNHLNRFNKENPNAVFVPVQEDTLSSAIDFLNEYEKYAPIHKNIEVEEMRRSKELLAHVMPLKQKAGFIEIRGTVVALAVGEVVDDTLYVHVEKARTDYAGAYQAIVSQFASYACAENVLYINREDDSGEEGLRYSKMAYRPIRLIDKYWAEIH